METLINTVALIALALPFIGIAAIIALHRAFLAERRGRCLHNESEEWRGS